MGLDPDPVAAYHRSGYAEQIVADRVGGTGQRAGLGTPEITDGAAWTAVTARSDSARSNRLGADPRNTNYAGGNTSAKGTADRPGHRRARSSCCGSRDPAATSAR